MVDSAVTLEKENVLFEKMSRLGIRQADIIEKFVRAQGPGGQNINKVATCVYLKHIPTGIEVKCQSERFQAQNRYLARQLLLKKIEEHILKRLREEKWLAEKERRKKRKRSKKSKEKILEEKHRRSEKKQLRSKMFKEE